MVCNTWRKDFTEEERRDFSVRKQILWESLGATKEEVNAKEMEMILFAPLERPFDRLQQMAEIQAGVSRLRLGT